MGAIITIFLFVAVLLIVIPIMNLILPNFQRQKHIAKIASFLGKSDNELRRMNQSPAVRYFSERILPKIDRKWEIDNIFGHKLRDRFNSLGREETYLEFLGKCLFLSIVTGFLIFTLGMFLKMPILYFMVPVILILALIAQFKDLETQFKKRQLTLIRDLPNLIGKIVTSLESGKPVMNIFKQVADQSKYSNPLLATLLKKLIANSEKMPMREALQVFANDVQLPVIYDFISVVHIAMEKGYKEAIPDFEAIKSDIQQLSRESMIVRTAGNPEKMNFFYALLVIFVLVFLILMSGKLFGAMNQI
ncbi:hypothetical protein M5X17_20480 [Paenibacillus alvei]|uniref:Flp pilus assembly protein TadB n=2 Tax=Paenibacillus alvei TaxID=44250 RepID=A0ABT4H7E7_PAEAL|nr:hypothetical protein [Paenibacillus alvei]MCY9542849.1 hypothetical protein [Paenibacillus alvei]MCY9736096.1 hypothetical protein [Paenibacillus alvei]MCY9764902.1 hypothetical protein [Paenibacillus alvei]MCY9771004.1 hypothetical protein [Paenibacillus alvei]MEC0084467.1 hypothetical protein [Paenibacillus alvei]